MTHHCLHRPPKVWLHGKAGMSHTACLVALCSASWASVPCCVQDPLGFQGFGLQRQGQAAWLVS